MKRQFEGFERVGRQISTERAVRGCFDKRTYDTKNQARDHGKRAEKTHNNPPMEPYKCHVCGLWHLTSLRKEQQAQARRKDWKKGQPK